MLQRIQSLFLSVVVVTLLSVGSMGIKRLQTVDVAEMEMVLGYVWRCHLLVSVLSVLSAGVALYALMRYDHRPLQRRLGILNTWLMMVLFALIVYLSMNQMALLLCSMALLSNQFSNAYIRKDEQLVRDADRIRHLH